MPISLDDASAYLMKSAASFGLNLSSVQAELLLQHLSLVREYNQKINLTNITEWQDGLVKHVLDSLLYAMPFKNGVLPCATSFIDIGTGAGYPGIPFAILTGLQGILIDSVAKKATAVRTFVSNLHLDTRISTQCVRIENFAVTHPLSFDIALARAVSDVSTLVEYASPILVSHGFLVLSVANMFTDDLVHLATTASLCGMEIVSRETFELPNGYGRRELLLIQKMYEPKIKLPRRVGLAKKRPLWKYPPVSRETMS